MVCDNIIMLFEWRQVSPKLWACFRKSDDRVIGIASQTPTKFYYANRHTSGFATSLESAKRLSTAADADPFLGQITQHRPEMKNHWEGIQLIVNSKSEATVSLLRFRSEFGDKVIPFNSPDITE